MLDPLIRLVSALGSPAGQRARLSILIYHRVVPREDPLFPSLPAAADFDVQMRTLARQFNVIPLADAVAGLRGGSLPARAACVTFDDGYADNAEVALPVLLRHRLPATFFVATDFIYGGRMWNDTIIEAVRLTRKSSLDLNELGLGTHEVQTLGERRKLARWLLDALKYVAHEERLARVTRIEQIVGEDLPRNLMMTTDQVRAMHRAGMGIGGHTASHPILARLDRAAARAEIQRGKDKLEEIIQSRVAHFAYPNGKPGEDYLPEHVGIVKEMGFDAAVTTAQGVSSGASDPYQLPRFGPWDKSPVKYALRMTQNLFRTSYKHV